MRPPSRGEVKKMIADWGDEGEIELLDFFAELTIYTSTACLIGLKFREQLDSRFAALLPRPGARHRPAVLRRPLPRRSRVSSVRDEARVKLVALVQEIMDQPLANPPQDKADRDMLDVLVSIKDEEGTPAVLRRRGHRHVHLPDVRGPPHQLGHLVVDADRVDPPPRGLREASSPSSRSSTPTARR